MKCKNGIEKHFDARLLGFFFLSSLEDVGLFCIMLQYTPLVILSSAAKQPSARFVQTSLCGLCPKKVNEPALVSDLVIWTPD